jgi:hypothetical protein
MLMDISKGSPIRKAFAIIVDGILISVYITIALVFFTCIKCSFASGKTFDTIGGALMVLPAIGGFIIGIVYVIATYKKLAKLKKLAKQGDAQAQYDLAKLYQDKKMSEGIQLFKQAAEKGHVLAQLELGNMYKNGNSVAKDIVQAISWFEKAAEQGNAEAQCELGYCYKMDGTKKDYAMAFNWLEKAAEQENAKAQYELGICYLIGEGVEENSEAANGWFEKAEKNGSVDARVFTGGGLGCLEGFSKKYSHVDQEKYVKLFTGHCLVINIIGQNLVKRGYRLSLSNYSEECAVWDNGKEQFSVCLNIYKENKRLGSMEFGTYGPKSEHGSFLSYDFSIEHSKNYRGDFNHIIHLDKSCVLIKSEVHCSEPPPEWMMICAHVIRISYEISYPEWMIDKPDAAKYVNVALR